MTPLRSALAALSLLAAPAFAQSDTDRLGPDVSQMSAHTGQMTMRSSTTGVSVDDALVFEPFQSLADMFLRDDVVFLMRHGPTDWSRLDRPNVAPDDCENQRVMIDEGLARMRDFGTLMAHNQILPSQIIVSQWCRNQQTVDALLEGVALIDPDAAEAMPVETDPALNLLLSLQGAPDVARLREIVSAWDGHPDRDGPLLIISHYTNIEELTQFRVFEGEVVVLDPDRENRVLGYLRLASAGPDVGHFADALASPLLSEQVALDMVTRYYQALNVDRTELLDGIIDETWQLHGGTPDGSPLGVDAFLDSQAALRMGLPDAEFSIDDIFVADTTVTVLGTLRGRHDGELFGIPATGIEVRVPAIAVHRIEANQIVETWQMANRTALLRQITGTGGVD